MAHGEWWCVWWAPSVGKVPWLMRGCRGSPVRVCWWFGWLALSSRILLACPSLLADKIEWNGAVRPAATAMPPATAQSAVPVLHCAWLLLACTLPPLVVADYFGRLLSLDRVSFDVHRSSVSSGVTHRAPHSLETTRHFNPVPLNSHLFWFPPFFSFRKLVTILALS